jgi:hypothetical protein
MQAASRCFSIAFLAVVTFSVASQAQVSSGDILGTIKDTSGAVVTGASITVTNVGTNLARTAVTDVNGDYVVASLPVGQYTVSAEHAGFRRTTATGINLQFDERARIDLTLQIGEVQQSVQVEDVIPLLATDTATVGHTLDSQNMTALPLNKRDYLSLTLLIPGVVPAQQGSIVAFFRGAVQVNGAREEANNFLLDGMQNKDDMIQGIVVQPSLDGIQEFKVQSSTYSAEYGSGGGAQINIITKSGTNKFHGTGFEFARNAVFDARNYFADSSQGKPEFKQNQFGGTFGGPIKRDRTFFFLNYEGRRLSQELLKTTSVPTLSMRTGNFVGLAPIFDPLTYDPTTGTAQQFPGNAIPANRIDPIAAKITTLLPLPNQTGALNFLGNGIFTDPIDTFLARFDEQFAKNSLTFRYGFYHGARFSPFERFNGRDIPGYGDTFGANDGNALLGWTKVIGTNKVNEMKIGYLHLNEPFFAQNRNINYVGMLGIQGLPYVNNPSDFGLPQFSITGIGLFGDGCCYPQIRWDRKYQFIDNFAISHGRHAWKVGGEFMYYHQDMILHQREALNFTANFTANPQNPSTTGNGFADFLLGYPTTSFRNSGNEEGNLRDQLYAAYFLDDWNVNRRLTLNLGIRYEYRTPYYDVNGDRSSFDPATATLIYPNKPPGTSPSLYNASKRDFAPRIGGTFRLNDRTVLHAGYGLFYTPENGNAEWAKSVTNPPLTISQTFIAQPFVPDLTLANPYPAAAALGGVESIAGIDKNFSNGYVQQWNANVERQITGNMSAQIGYVGSRGTNLASDININQPFPGPGPTQPRRPYPQFGSITMLQSAFPSIYKSLQAKFQARLGGGQNLLVAYTLSRSMDLLSAYYCGASFTCGGLQNWHDLSTSGQNWGLSNFDRRHFLSVSYVADLPFGHGKRFLSDARIASAILGGLQVNGIYQYGSGNPLTVTLPFDNSGTGNFADRPNVIGNPVPSDQGPTNWINSTAFVVPPQFTFGNAGRNTVIGPPTNRFDFSLFKNFTIRERSQLQLRAEAFNIFNHPNFFQPGSALGTPSFGQITQAYDGRDIQLGVRFSF